MSNDKTFNHTVNSMAFLNDTEIGMGGTDSFVSIWKYWQKKILSLLDDKLKFISENQ